MNQNFFQYNAFSRTIEQSSSSALMYVSLIKCLADLTKLEAGWDYGDGEVISEQSISAAEKLVGSTCDLGYVITIHPTNAGGLVFVFANNNDFYDIGIDKFGSQSLIHERGKGFDFDVLMRVEKISFSEALNFLTINSPKWQLLSESSIGDTLTSVSKGFKVPHSPIPMASLFSTGYAQSEPVELLEAI